MKVLSSSRSSSTFLMHAFASSSAVSAPSSRSAPMAFPCVGLRFLATKHRLHWTRVPVRHRGLWREPIEHEHHSLTDLRVRRAVQCHPFAVCSHVEPASAADLRHVIGKLVLGATLRLDDHQNFAPFLSIHSMACACVSNSPHGRALHPPRPPYRGLLAT